MKHPPQEPNRVPVNLVVGVILGVIAAIAIGCVAASAIARWRTAELHGDPRAVSERLRGVPPEVVPPEVNAMETVLFRAQAPGLASHRVAEAWLASYGWVDRGRRILHVPIEVAFEVYLRSRRGGAP